MVQKLSAENQTIKIISIKNRTVLMIQNLEDITENTEHVLLQKNNFLKLYLP